MPVRTPHRGPLCCSVGLALAWSYCAPHRGWCCDAAVPGPAAAAAVAAAASAAAAAASAHVLPRHPNCLPDPCLRVLRGFAMKRQMCGLLRMVCCLALLQLAAWALVTCAVTAATQAIGAFRQVP